jgi:hypothetical protein
VGWALRADVAWCSGWWKSPSPAIATGKERAPICATKRSSSSARRSPQGVRNTLPRCLITPLSIGLGDKVFPIPHGYRQAEHVLRFAAKIGAGVIACLNTLGKWQNTTLFRPHSTQPQTTPAHEFCTPIRTGSAKNLTMPPHVFPIPHWEGGVGCAWGVDVSWCTGHSPSLAISTAKERAPICAAKRSSSSERRSPRQL